MPLPERNIAWPPAHLAPALKAMNTWDTWWTGDPDRLEQLYGRGGIGAVGGPDPKPVQYASGLAGYLARMWWGTPPAPGELRTKLHVPIAGDICAGSADLLFSEPPTFRAAASDTATQQRIDALADDGMLAFLQTAGEIDAALGGIYLRPVYDKTIADRPWLDAVHADRAVPEFRWGRLAAVTFWRIVGEQDGQVWRHLERHEPGVNLHGLYQGTKDNLGRPVPLRDRPETTNLADAVNDDGAVPTGFDPIDVAFIRNKVSRRWRREPALKDLGRSDLDGIEHLMDQLDETYSSWMRDIRLGKGRIVVPNAYLTSLGPGRGARFDPDQEVYAGLDMMARSDGQQLTVSQFAIRVAEHRETAQDLVEQILRSAGYSAQTFGEESDGEPATATEVTARGQRSLVTRGRKVLEWRPGLAHAWHALLHVDREVFGSRVTPQRPAVEFADGVQEDPLTLAQTAEMLRRAEAASTDTLVHLVHKDWDEARVKAEAERIMRESGQAVADPTLTGAEGIPGPSAVEE